MPAARGRAAAEPRDDPDAAKNAALRLITARPRSVAELADRLRRKNFAEPAVARTIADLAAVGLLDDEAFAAALVRTELARKPAGERLLLAKLRAKGVGDAVAKPAVRAALAERSGSADADALIAKKLRTLPAGLDRAAAARRLMGLAARRGFDHETARAAVERALHERAGG